MASKENFRNKSTEKNILN